MRSRRFDKLEAEKKGGTSPKKEGVFSFKRRLEMPGEKPEKNESEKPQQKATAPVHNKSAVTSVNKNTPIGGGLASQTKPTFTPEQQKKAMDLAKRMNERKLERAKEEFSKAKTKIYLGLAGIALFIFSIYSMSKGDLSLGQTNAIFLVFRLVLAVFTGGYY